MLIQKCLYPNPLQDLVLLWLVGTVAFFSTFLLEKIEQKNIERQTRK